MAARGRLGRERTPGPRVSPGTCGRAEGGPGVNHPAAPPGPPSGVLCSPQPRLQVGKLRQGKGPWLFCRSTDLTAWGGHRASPQAPAGQGPSPREQQWDGWRQRCWGEALGGTGHGPALSWDPLESRALAGPAPSSPAEEHGRGTRLRSPPSPGRAGMETSQPRVEKFGGSSLENSAGNSPACKTPRLVQMLKNAKMLHPNVAPARRR